MEGETTIQPVVLLEECVESLPVWVLYVVLPIYGGAIVLLVILGVLTFLLAKKTKTRIEEEYEEHSESESERESIDMDEMRELYEVIPDEYMKRDSFASSDPRSSLHQINEEEEDDENEDDAYKEEMDEPISDEISDSSLVKNIDNMQPQASPDLLSSLSHQSSPSFIPLKRLYSENKGDPEASTGLLNNSILFIDEC